MAEALGTRPFWTAVKKEERERHITNTNIVKFFYFILVIENIILRKNLKSTAPVTQVAAKIRHNYFYCRRLARENEKNVRPICDFTRLVKSIYIYSRATLQPNVTGPIAPRAVRLPHSRSIRHGHLSHHNIYTAFVVPLIHRCVHRMRGANEARVCGRRNTQAIDSVEIDVRIVKCRSITLLFRRSIR